MCLWCVQVPRMTDVRRSEATHDVSTLCMMRLLKNDSLLLWKQSFLNPPHYPPHTLIISSKSPSLIMETSPIRRTPCWLTSLCSASPSSAGSSQQLLEPNKGNPLMAVIVCGWQVPEWQPASKAWGSSQRDRRKKTEGESAADGNTQTQEGTERANSKGKVQHFTYVKS